MKAKELMIGDWVSIKCGRKLQLGLEQFWAQFSHENEENPIDYFGDFEPIPLTEEILLANRFEVIDKNEHFKLVKYERQDQWLRYRIFYDGRRRCFSISPIGSCVRIVNVHELQHALRLCGLNELADNFKIK